MPSTATAADERPEQTQTAEEEDVITRERGQRQRGQCQHQRSLQPAGPGHRGQQHERHGVHLEPGVHLPAVGPPVRVEQPLPPALKRVPHDVRTGPGLQPGLRGLVLVLHRAGLQLVPVTHAHAAVRHGGRAQSHRRELHGWAAQSVSGVADVTGLRRRVSGLQRRRLFGLQRPDSDVETELQRGRLSGLQGSKLVEVPGPVDQRDISHDECVKEVLCFKKAECSCLILVIYE